MFNNDRISAFSRLYALGYFGFSSLYYHIVFKKRFERIESRPMIWGIWNIVVYGPNITLGSGVIMVGAGRSSTTLTTICTNDHEGRITIGNDVLIMNGVRISSACGIVIEDSCMLANFCYLTDADWHDVHDRTACPGGCGPITLKRGAWIGDSAIICKGVTIGENAVVGAGSVVTRNVPPNVVAAGNPARVVKKLNPDKIILRGQPVKYSRLEEEQYD